MASGEFATISELFAPLSDSAHGLGLGDDAARVRPDPGFDIIATADQIVAGQHFIGDESAGDIARKALRVNLSDLAAMGAAPRYYLLSLALPGSHQDAWLRDFAGALAGDQKTYEIVLVGGDTAATDGPLVVGITAMGQTRIGTVLRRSGAAAGDIIYVSGTIGDAALGLALVKGRLMDIADGTISEEEAEWLRDRYRVPQPRCGLGIGLAEFASAAIDISDGLIADLGHIVEASGAAAVIGADQVPVSGPARGLLAAQPDLLDLVLTGGDDYELLFTAHPEMAPSIGRLAREIGLPLTPIGTMTAGSGVSVRDEEGREFTFSATGYTHF
jgi:thiamine-monophosphate kinase